MAGSSLPSLIMMLPSSYPRATLFEPCTDQRYCVTSTAITGATTNLLHQRQATSTWWCSPLPYTGEGRNGLSIPRGSHPRAILFWTTLLIFYPCCPMRGHMWTALLNPIERPPTPSIFFRTSLPRPSFHPKPLHYSSHSPLILISMLLLISGDIHPNPGPIDPCSVCSRRVTWGNRSIQCTNCSLWVHLSCSGLSPADFRKISPGNSWTCPMCPSSSQPLPSLSHSNPVSSFFSVSPSSHTPKPHLHSQTTTKPYLQKLNPPPKQPRITIFLITPN